MVKKMLVDANHPEETRVVVINGEQLDGFDIETASRKHCLLYTSDAADDSLRVDLGGRRII